jgi:exosortase
MSHSVAEAEPLATRAPAAVQSWSLAVTAIGFLLLWLELIHQLQSEWSLNPQYGYGWTVPFLAAYLFYQRWTRRPPPATPHSPGLTISIPALAAIVLLPARLVAVANPDWRLLSWTMTLAVVVISLCALHLAGSVPWLKHFAFPVLFFLVATPWPAQLEQIVVQSLMRADSAITVQILNLLGTVALQHGYVIELSTGQVGIDDACTGVRSLQATLMVSLFLGEFYRLRPLRRVVLIVFGAALAFVCNIGRTFLLCQVAASSGIPAIHRWHDPAGFTILVICLFGLWALSMWLKPAPIAEVPPRVHAAVRSPFRGLWYSAALIFWIGLTEVAVAAWYAPASQITTATPWTVIWPTNEPDYRPEPVPEAAETLLRYNEGGAATWRSADDHHWLMYSFRWLPGRTAALFVKNHRPDICLPATGLTMEEQSGVHLVTVNGVNLPIRSYRFNAHGRPLHIFYCYWDGRSSYVNDAAAAAEDWTARGRLEAAWRGKREVGSRMLELAVWGHQDDQEAQAALRRELEKIVRPS